MEGWDSFFVATVGAAAALAGLIIVAMTVNIDTIIKNAGLPSRAGATVASLILVVIAGGAALIPRIGLVGLGGVVLAATAIATVLYLRSGYEGFRHRTPASKPLIKLTWSVIQMAPYIVGAVLLLLGDASGLYWIAGGILLTFVGSTLNAWVLLVEILR